MPERIPLIFSDNEWVDMVRNISGDDAQSVINVVDEVSACTRRTWLTRIQISTLRQLGIGKHRATNPQEVPTLFIRCLWPPSPVPELLDMCRDLRISLLDRRGFGALWKGMCNGRKVGTKVLGLSAASNPGKARKVGYH
jgi:hypothetical protein